jgi:chromosome segregation ATPase
LSLLEGRFDYTEQGLLDRTHLRFFDRRGAERLIREAGLTIAQHLRVRRELDETEIEVHKHSVPAELLQTLATDPDATTYQFVFVAGRMNGVPEPHSGAMLSERLLAENEALTAQFKDLETHARSLQSERADIEAIQAQAAAEKESLLARLAEAEETAKRLEGDLTAARTDAARELDASRDELARLQSLQSRATAEQAELLVRFKDVETYAKRLEADLTAVREDAERDLDACRDELARTRALQSLGAAEALEAQRERDELRNELLHWTRETHEKHRDLKHCKADLAIREAFIDDLRQQLLALQPVVSERDQLWLERNQLSKQHARLAGRRKRSSIRHGKLLEERRRLLARQREMEKALAALRTHADSAGFRITEAVIQRLRRFPMVFETTRKIARRVAGRKITVG